MMAWVFRKIEEKIPYEEKIGMGSLNSVMPWGFDKNNKIWKNWYIE